MAVRMASVDAHRVGRRLGSKEMVRPAARITSMVLIAAGSVVAEMAGNTPVACRWRADVSQSTSTSSNRHLTRGRALAVVFDRRVAAVGDAALELEAGLLRRVAR